MKHILLIIPLIALLNSCAGSTLVSQNNVETAVAGTHIAMTLTAAPTPTPNVYIPTIISWMNNDLANISPLGWTLDAEYHVTDVSFPLTPEGVILQVDVGCICMNSDKCCTPERTFVVIAESMRRNSGAALTQVTGNISAILVVCSDQQSKKPIGAMTVSWPDMQGYLQGALSGYQLGVRVTQTAVP